MNSLRTEIIDITPEMAAEWLKNNPNFRKLDLKRVAAYQKDMAALRWELNGETIKIGLNGEIVDGQTRLTAIKNSGLTIRMIVVFGVPSNSKTIDSGKPRTVGQWLGHKGFKSAVNCASTARLVIQYEIGKWGSPTLQVTDLRPVEHIEFAEKHRGRLESAVRVSHRANIGISPTLLSALLFIGSGKDRIAEDCKTALWFSEKLKTGEGLGADEAALHLRNRVLGQKEQRKIAPMTMRALVTIAWNKTVKGDPCTPAALRLRLSGPGKEVFPSEILEAEE